VSHGKAALITSLYIFFLEIYADTLKDMTPTALRNMKRFFLRNEIQARFLDESEYM
jgi:phosphatidylserine decarboxylase